MNVLDRGIRLGTGASRTGRARGEHVGAVGYGITAN